MPDSLLTTLPGGDVVVKIRMQPGDFIGALPMPECSAHKITVYYKEEAKA